MSDVADQITFHLDPDTREQLSKLASQENATASEAAEKLFRSALRNATMTPDDVTALVESIPGAVDRALERRAKFERGEGRYKALEDLL
jgi:hypothetical protein